MGSKRVARLYSQGNRTMAQIAHGKPRIGSKFVKETTLEETDKRQKPKIISRNPDETFQSTALDARQKIIHAKSGKNKEVTFIRAPRLYKTKIVKINQ
jgi:hypothetical protein